MGVIIETSDGKRRRLLSNLNNNEKTLNIHSSELQKGDEVNVSLKLDSHYAMKICKLPEIHLNEKSLVINLQFEVVKKIHNINGRFEKSFTSHGSIQFSEIVMRPINELTDRIIQCLIP